MIIKARIIPNSSRNQIVGWFKDQLKIKISAPPERGKANQKLINFLSEKWNIPKHSIQIIKGHKKRDKVIEIEGIQKLPIPKPEQTQLKI